ncbi:hypothetical protein [Bacillus sp. FJAT-45350]|nr:hypothetical protein [Bacillus sp. FJAT-45350]
MKDEQDIGTQIRDLGNQFNINDEEFFEALEYLIAEYEATFKGLAKR